MPVMDCQNSMGVLQTPNRSRNASVTVRPSKRANGPIVEHEQSHSEMVKFLLSQFQHKLVKTKRKEAINLFEIHHFSNQARLPRDDIMLLLYGNTTTFQVGLLEICGHMSAWKGKLKVSAGNALGLLLRLIDDTTHPAQDRCLNVFLGSPDASVCSMNLGLHLITFDKLQKRRKKIRGNKEAAQRILDIMAENNMAPPFDLESSQRDALNRMKVKQTSERHLHMHLGERPDRDALVQRNILHEQPPPSKRTAWRGIARWLTTRMTKEDLLTGGILKAPATFGVPLEKLCSGQDTQVPSIVRECCDYLRQGDRLSEQGLFRLSGDLHQIEDLKRKLDYPDERGKADLEDYGTHVIAGIFKMYIRELPIPIFTFEQYAPLIDAFTELDMDTIEELERSLPPAHLATWVYIADFLAEVAALANQNMMHVNNLAIIFAPNVLRPKVQTFAALAETPKVVGVVNYLLAVRTKQLKEIKERERTASRADHANAWTELLTDAGDVFYCNTETGESLWEKPPEMGGQARQWVQLADDEGNVYYEDKVTGMSQWERPAGFTDPEVAAVAASGFAMDGLGGERISADAGMGGALAAAAAAVAAAVARRQTTLA